MSEADIQAVHEAAAEARAAAADLLAASEAARQAALADAIGPNRMIRYGDFLREMGLSYDQGAAERRAGRLKAVEVGGVLMVRAGHAEEFARSLPLKKPAPARRRRR